MQICENLRNSLQLAGPAPASSSSSSSSAPLFRLILNARQAFPYPPRGTKTSTLTWSSSPGVSKALSILPEHEQAAVLRYYHPSDAALSLGSLLLKHLAITRACGVSWEESEISQTRDVQNGKPYFKPGGVEFNVSHHGDVVVLVASTKPGLKVGIDVVKVDTERDRRGLDQGGGFAGWVRNFGDAFSDRETKTMVESYSQDSSLDKETLLRKRLRLFYANWAFKEAYIKMTGDALMAKWLKDLEFTKVEPPGTPDPETVDGRMAWGDVTSTPIVLEGNPVEKVKIELQTLGEDYMVATSISEEERLPGFEEIEIPQSIPALFLKMAE